LSSYKFDEYLDAKLGVVNGSNTDNNTTTGGYNGIGFAVPSNLARRIAEQLIGGQFATGRVGATNLLSTLGLASPADVTKLNKSQEYQKVAGDVILQTLGGKLGSGARFAALKSKIQSKGGKSAKAAGAIAASIGRKKYGAKKMTAMAVAGRKKAK
jgi:S1-C subfamily serine protease